MHRISVSIKLFQFKLIHLIRISDFIVLVLLNFVHPLPTESFVGAWDALLLWLLLLVISTTYVQLSVNHRSSYSSSYEASGGCCCRPSFPMMTGVLEWLEETPPLPFIVIRLDSSVDGLPAPLIIIIPSCNTFRLLSWRLFII